MPNDVCAPLSLNFGYGTPIMPVSDLPASLAYYTEKLGFKLDWHAPDQFASVSRDNCTIFLAGGQGNVPTWIWVGVGDTAALFEEYFLKGARVRHAPANHYWALEMQVADPDGNVLRFGSDPDDDAPAPEWCDLRGDYWSGSPEAGWTKIEAADGANYFLAKAESARESGQLKYVRWNLYNAIELLRVHGTEAELEAALRQWAEIEN